MLEFVRLEIDVSVASANNGGAATITQTRARLTDEISRHAIY